MDCGFKCKTIKYLGAKKTKGKFLIYRARQNVLGLDAKNTFYKIKIDNLYHIKT